MKEEARRLEEGKEHLDTVKNEAPESKYQNEQQIAPSTGFKTNPGKSNFVLDKKKAAGSELKQEVASSVVRDSLLGGSNSGDGASFAGTRSSGSDGGVLGAANATPNVGKDTRSGNRTGKKLDRNSTKLNFIPSDQVLTEWDESKPLADAANEDQGYNGTYRNEFARSQKRVENVPGALMFDRSLDLLLVDKLYFGQGQIVKQEDVDYQEAVTLCAKKDARGVYVNVDVDNYAAGKYGNFLGKDVQFAFDTKGKLRFLAFDEEELTPTVDQYDANKSSAAMKIAINRSELFRETMDEKAGDEKADIWTPLARAVRQPTQTVGLFEALEADIGNELMVGYRKASVSMSYQLNRAHKDGQLTDAPGVEALLGLNKNYVSAAAAKAGLATDIQHAFAKQYYVNGCASTMIALYDSTSKYKTKADLIVQPRSFRMHLQTADNNMDPFYVDKKLAQIYDVTETFSTIDREYDPMAPVCFTDKAAVIHRLSWHKMGSFCYDKYDVLVTKDADVTEAKTVVIFPVGMMSEIKAHGYNIYLLYPSEASGSISANSDDSGFVASTNYEFANYPTKGGVTLLLAKTAPTPGSDMSLATIANADINVNKAFTVKTAKKVSHIDVDVATDAAKVDAYQGGEFVYLYHDLRNNYVMHVKHPMIQGMIDFLEQSAGRQYRSLVGADVVTVQTIHSAQFFSLWSFLLCAATPFIGKARINSFRDLLYYEKNVEYPFNDALASMKEVKTKSYLNFGYINYDTELEVKRMAPATALTWLFPEMMQQVGYDSSNSEIAVLMPWYTNQIAIKDGAFDDDASVMSFPSIRSGVRLAALDTLYGMSEKDVRLSCDMIASWKGLNATIARSAAYKYSAVGDGQLVLAIAATGIKATDFLTLPRELGWVITAPYGVLTPKYDHSYGYGDDIVGATGYRATYWVAPGALKFENNQAILDAKTENIERAANFVQEWFSVLASGTVPSFDHGFVLSANQAYGTAGAPLVGRTKFTPFAGLSDNAIVTSNKNYLLSMQKFLWTRIQKIPFVLSPFDCVKMDNTGTPNNFVIADPFDLCYVFGLGGFRGSDYRESVYNREKEIVNQGILFVSDPWVEASPLFKEGAAASGIKTTKGFEL